MSIDHCTDRALPWPQLGHGRQAYAMRTCPWKKTRDKRMHVARGAYVCAVRAALLTICALCAAGSGDLHLALAFGGHFSLCGGAPVCIT